MARRPTEIIRDEQTQNPITGVLISVIDATTGLAATLTLDGGASLSNPFTNDEYGAYYYNATDAVYIEELRYGGRLYAKNEVIVGSPPAFVGPAGPGNSLSAGTVTKIAPGGTPTISITGTSPAQVLNVGLVTGDTGGAGPTGPAGYTSTDTWAHLNAITPSGGAGSTGFAIGPDTGTHTDANGATLVPNTGQFTYQASPAGWIRTGAATSPGDSALNTAALSTFVGASETVGIAPASDTAGPTNALIFINTPSTYDSTLDSFTARVRTVGDGTARLVACINSYTANQVVVLGFVAMTGIASTGIKTFTAGTDYNLLDANGLPIVFPAGTRFALGSATGGVQFDTQVSTGAGFNLPANAGGYFNTQATGSNFIGKFQVTLGRVKTVRAAISAATALPIGTPGESPVIEYAGPDDLVFGAVGNQGNSFSYGNNIPFYNDGQIIGVQYASAAAGDELFVVFRSGVIVDWRRATLTLGDRLTATFATPFAVKAGDTLYQIPLTGFLKSQNWSNQPGVYSTSNVAWNGATFTSLNIQPAMRAIIQRPRKPRLIAAASSRGQTTTIDQRFRGATLPGNTTFSATTVNGSRNMTLVSGTPVVGAPISGSGIPSFVFVMAVNGSTVVMSDLATASATITVTQTGWTAAGTGTWTCSNGLISPSSALTDWARRYMHPVPINAQRRTILASVLIGDLTNIGGICSAAQHASTLTTLGSVIHIDAPANKGRVYIWGSDTGIAPPNAGLEVVLPWTLAAADVVTIAAQVDRGKMTVWFTNAKTGQSASIVSNYALGVLATPIHGGVMSGQLGAHFLQGTGGMKWSYIQNITHISNAGSRTFWFTDSRGHLAASDNANYNPAHRIEDARAKGDFINLGKSAQTALGVLATLPQDFLALIGSTGAGTEIVWDIGVNPDNYLGTTDLQRYTAFKTLSLIAFGIFEYFGCKVTVLTPTPNSTASTYIPYTITQELAGDLGDRPVIDVGRAVSVAGDGAAWIALLSQDGLHPCPFTGGPLIASALLAQRPDWAGAI